MKENIFDETIKILENKKINQKYYKLSFLSHKLSSKVSPGQFLHVQINTSEDPFLRRPFSYYKVSGKRVEILYEVLGRGTKILSEKTKGMEIKVMGPLGKGFRAEVKNKKRVLIAGGIGVPPMIFLAEKFRTDYILIGTRSKNEIIPKSELEKVRAKIYYSTDDGSYGIKGNALSLLEKVLKTETPKNIFIQTCGPKQMMDAILKKAKKLNMEGEASLDESMACGVGACLGCMVETTDGMVPSCTCGPVFNFEKIKKIL